MRSIALRWPVGRRALALVLAAQVFALASFGSTKPRYGGALRVEFLAAPVSLDPRQGKIGSREVATAQRLDSLLFDRLISLDNYGRFVPQLATEWSHDASLRRWQFTLRAGVKFSDGTQFSAAEAAVALAPLLPEGVQVSVSGSNLAFQSAEPRPDLLEVLASGKLFLYHALPDGTLAGTGAFILDETSRIAKLAGTDNFTASQPTTQHLRFVANEDCWAGRPFVDAVEVTLGVPPLRALFDLQVGKADLVELAPDFVRRANQANVRVWASSPLTLYALRFDDSQPAASNEVLREAVSLSLDRNTMASVLLQKQAEPAAALLPQWLSGYAFLHHLEMNFDRAKELRASLQANLASGTAPLRLQTDAAGDLAHLLAERVAINARQTGFSVRPLTRAPQRDAGARSTEPAELHLFAWRYSSLSPGEELQSLVKAAHLDSAKEGNPFDPERRYSWERKLLEERKLMPLVVLPDYAGVATNVRDWQPNQWGEWHLADVWLEPAGTQPGTSKSAAPTSSPSSGARP